MRRGPRARPGRLLIPGPTASWQTPRHPGGCPPPPHRMRRASMIPESRGQVTAMKKTSNRREKRQLSALMPFPHQKDYFDALSDADLALLAADIKANGLRNAIEVLPKNKAGYRPNTVISGHQRWRALELIGRVETEVLVRDDLAQADEAAIERAFLVENLARRQLDGLAKARIALRLYEIERQKPRGGLSGLDLGEARDRVGAAIGVSGRTLSRYLRVL